MLLTSVLLSLLAWLTRSTPIFIVDERVNIYISLTVSAVFICDCGDLFALCY